MFLGPSPIGYAVCDLVRIAGVDVDDQDLAAGAMRGATAAMESDLRPIWGPSRKVVAKALWGMGDLADVGSVRVHREDGAPGQVKIQVAAKGDQTVLESIAKACALLVVLLASALGS